jgi:hypothetical protein
VETNIRWEWGKALISITIWGTLLFDARTRAALLSVKSVSPLTTFLLFLVISHWGVVVVVVLCLCRLKAGLRYL